MLGAEWLRKTGLRVFTVHSSRTSSNWLHRTQASQHFWRELASLVCWIQAKPILALSGFSLNAQISGLQLAPWRHKSICTIGRSHSPCSSLLNCTQSHCSEPIAGPLCWYIPSLLSPSPNWACGRESWEQSFSLVRALGKWLPNRGETNYTLYKVDYRLCKTLFSRPWGKKYYFVSTLHVHYNPTIRAKRSRFWTKSLLSDSCSLLGR